MSIASNSTVIILGSTGSIGTQGLDVISRHPERFTVTGLAAGGAHIELLAQQAAQFHVSEVAVFDETKVPALQAALAQAGTQALSQDRARDIAAATVEQLDLALTRRAVETGHNKAALLTVLLHQLGGTIHAERTVVMERHNRRGVQERQAQVLRHQASGEVLATAHELLGRVAARAGALGKGRELLADGIGELQLVSDIKIALADVLEQLLTRHVILNVRVNQVEQVGHLGVALKAAAAGGNHHKTAGRVGIDDGLDLLEVFGVGDRRAAKLGNLNHGLEVTFLKASANLFCAL